MKQVKLAPSVVRAQTAARLWYVRCTIAVNITLEEGVAVKPVEGAIQDVQRTLTVSTAAGCHQWIVRCVVPIVIHWLGQIFGLKIHRSLLCPKQLIIA